jgi:hypothetical protein
MKMKTIGLMMVSAVVGVGWMASPVAAQVEQPGVRQDTPGLGQTFAGKIEAVDTGEKTLTVGGKQIYVVDSTRLMRADKPITLGDLKVGEDVHGTSRQTFDGKTQAITVMAGVPEKKEGGSRPE